MVYIHTYTYIYIYIYTPINDISIPDISMDYDISILAQIGNGPNLAGTRRGHVWARDVTTLLRLKSQSSSGEA